MGIIFANESVAPMLRQNKVFDAHLVIAVQNQNKVDPRIANHTDLSVFIDDYIVVEPSMYESVYNQVFSKFGIEWTNTHLFCGKANLSPFYPQDIAYNVLPLKDHLVHLSQKTDSEILKLTNKEHFHVKQGYTRCTCLPVGKSAVITEDESISEKLLKLNYDVLTIQSGGVDLPGFPYGFIGGAGGSVDNYLVLNGSLCHHPEAECIKDFVKKRGMTIFELHDGKLVDCGSILYYTEKTRMHHD